MDNRGEVLFTDLGALCEPQAHISPLRERYKWCSVPYETADRKGTMLTAVQMARPEDVSLDPGLAGWYKIFLGLPAYYGGRLRLRLSGEEEWMLAGPAVQGGYGGHVVEEAFWRAADLTGQKLVIGKHRHGKDSDAMLAWVRFVPMSDDEVRAWQADLVRTDTKRIYATNDMHNRGGIDCPESLADWRGVVKDYEDSDVEWLSMENIFIFDGSIGNPDNFAFCRPFDAIYARRFRDSYTPEVLRDLIAFGHRQGLKMCMSMRMGAWGMEYPYDQTYFVNRFKEAHPELRCIDRDGTPIDALSYAYPEVRRYVIEQFLSMADLGCDAVEMIFTRGVPYVLFEEPVLRRFREETGEDARTLPLDDPRLNALHCRIMTEFVKELRAALDARRGKIGLHARINYSLYDSRYVALDAETWAREGLITAVISYPLRVRELLDGDVWAGAPGGQLDLKKYAQYVRTCPHSPVLREGSVNTFEPLPDSRGVPQGPADQAARVAELMRLEKDYGVRVYIEIMPRQMSAAEYQARALELYDAGAGGISLWDTYVRAPHRSTWTMVRRLGHKDELRGFDPGEGEWYSTHRLLKVGGQDVSRYVPAWGG